MSRVSEVFQSRFLKAIDLLDDESGEYREPKVTIEGVQVEDLPSRNGQNQSQPVLYFAGKKKVLPLNKTNATILQDQLGDEMDDWKGKVIQLYVTTTTFEGAQKQVIRIKPKGKPRAARAAADDFSSEDAAPVAAAAAAPARRAPAAAAAPAPAAAAADKGFDPDEVPF